jgi:hypothetical protein
MTQSPTYPDNVAEMPLESHGHNISASDSIRLIPKSDNRFISIFLRNGTVGL